MLMKKVSGRKKKRLVASKHTCNKGVSHLEAGAKFLLKETKERARIQGNNGGY